VLDRDRDAANNEMKKYLAKKMKVERGLSIKEIAEKLGITQQEVKELLK
jgi:predicted transcriptional regulator